MNRFTLSSVILLSLLTATALIAQEKGTWRAASKNARAITGDVALAEEKLSINFYSFPMAQIRTLSPAEVAIAFDADSGSATPGNLYRLSIPANRKLMGKNTLCGSDDTQWMATSVSGKTLQLAFFSGPSMPVFTPEAFANPTNLCGIFAYVK